MITVSRVKSTGGGSIPILSDAMVDYYSSSFFRQSRPRSASGGRAPVPVNDYFERAYLKPCTNFAINNINQPTREYSYDNRERPGILLRIGILKDKMLSFKSLKKGWNTYGADPPNGKAIAEAIRSLPILLKKGMVINNVAPSSDEGIIVEFLNCGRYNLLEFYNEGEIVYLYRDGQGRSFVEDVTIATLGDAIKSYE